MSIFEILLLSVGLAMDAFAVAICKGLAFSKTSVKHYITVGLWFGGFQALMPLIGYFLGCTFSSYIEKIDHWVAFALLLLIGLNMIKEALGKEEEADEKMTTGLAVGTMLVLAVATSIDALAVGVSLAFLNVNIWVAVLLIGVITFAISSAGVKIGNVFGTKYKKKAEFAGGAILIILGIKILIEGLMG